MVRPKKQSKRLSCHKKYKIIKKVKEHNRKVRKEEKKKANSKRKPKDPGIPNSYPFKEQLLKQIQEKKEQQLQEKQKQKEQKEKQASKKRKLQDLKRDAEKRTKEFEKRQAQRRGRDGDKKNASLESSRKSFYKEFKKVVEAADVVIQVLDARDPLGCRCPQLEEIVMGSGKNKKLILLLNKIDLVPRSIAEKWLKYLRSEFPTLAFKASTQTQRNKLAQSKVSIDVASQDLLQTSSCLGANTLLKLLGNYCRSQDMKTAITVGIVGFPNVGKSSVINSLKRSKACNVGSTPGLTKNMQQIQLDKHVKLLDSPGIVMATGSSDTQIILRNAVKIEQLDDPVQPVEAILNRCNKHQMMQKYCVADYKDAMEFLTLLASRLGKLKKGGIPDVHVAAKILLQDWNSGKISFYTHPPERKENEEHESSQVVQYLGAGFDLKAIEKEESDDMAELLDVMETAMVLNPGKPAVMEVEQERKSSIAEEDEMESDADDKDDEEETSMVEEDDLDLGTIVIAKKRKVANKDVTEKRDQPVLDSDNLQTNRIKKKAFKQRQKDERRRVSKLLEDDSNRMEDDDEDDTYDFNVVT